MTPSGSITAGRKMTAGRAERPATCEYNGQKPRHSVYAVPRFSLSPGRRRAGTEIKKAE